MNANDLSPTHAHIDINVTINAKFLAVVLIFIAASSVTKCLNTYTRTDQMMSI